MSEVGIGVMIQALGGNGSSVKAYKKAIGLKIESVKLENDALWFTFEGGYKMKLSDEGQSCCEHRYMVTDDNLDDYVGAIFLGAEIKDAPNVEDPYGEAHEVQFLEIKTDKGVFTMATHNEHNGYYGGFWVVASEF